MKKARIISAVVALGVALLGLLGVLARNVDAAGSIYLETGSKITIEHEIRSIEAEDLTARFDYKIEEIDGKNAVMNLPQTYIEVNDVPFIDHLINRSIDVNLSQVRVRTEPGEYKLKLSCTSDNEFFACDSIYYTITIAVENILDANQVPTGQYTARIVALRKVVNGREIATKLEKANFYTEEELPPEPVYSYITLKNLVEGDLASEDDVFKYIVTLEGEEGREYAISAPTGSYTFNGEAVTSDTVILGGNTATIYLKHGETATIGCLAQGDGLGAQLNLVASLSLIALGENEDQCEKQVLVGTVYSYKVIPDVEGYKTWIDDKDNGERTEIQKTVAEDPKSNVTTFINSHKKPSIPEKIVDFVNTGLKYKNGAFIVLGLGSAIVILIILLQRKKKNDK